MPKDGLVLEQRLQLWQNDDLVIDRGEDSPCLPSGEHPRSTMSCKANSSHCLLHK